MPAVSKKQQQFMAICAHSPDKAKGACPSSKVAEEFSHKPKGGYAKKGARELFKKKKGKEG